MERPIEDRSRDGTRNTENLGTGRAGKSPHKEQPSDPPFHISSRLGHGDH